MRVRYQSHRSHTPVPALSFLPVQKLTLMTRLLATTAALTSDHPGCGAANFLPALAPGLQRFHPAAARGQCSAGAVLITMRRSTPDPAAQTSPVRPRI